MSIPVPEAYAIGWVPFLGTKIWLDSKPLIPRPETEWWTEKAIEKMMIYHNKSRDGGIRVLDLFAGSGCVGVAVLMHIPNVTVDFGELDLRHLTTIQKNISENKIDPARTKVLETNVYSNISGQYDFILANPPYLSQSRIERVQDSVLTHEPHTALFADEDGFALIRQTIEGAQSHLLPGGQAWIEHEPEHSAKIVELAQSLGASAQTHTDQYGTLRYSVILQYNT